MSKNLTRIMAVAALIIMMISAVKAQDEPVTLTIWYNSASPDAFVNVFERWAEETGNAVELVAIPADGFENAVLTRWAAGERPDIMEYHATPAAVLQLNTENLQDLSDEAFIELAPALYPALGTVDGHTYAAITSFPQVFGLYYNKQVLADAGIEPPQNFTELAAACETLKEVAPDVIPIWESGGSLWPTQLLPVMYLADMDTDYLQSLLDKETTADAPDSPLVAALTAYSDLLNNGCFPEDITTTTFENGISVVAEGGAAMVALPPVTALWNEQFDGDTELADSTIGETFPASNGPAAWWGASPTGSYYAPLTGDSAREAAALDFIRYATGDGYQETIDESQTFPVMEGFENPADAQGLTLLLKEIYDFNSGPSWDANRPPGIQFDVIMGTLVSGQATPEQAAVTYQLQLEQGAIAAGLPGWE
ncbi:MAG: carbohydrate ABC transporter substrate-binding protein [Anaerolineaceae bacterium]|nr:carbohydrate ABC transporter substrate-binding protein [Anaerolineaceae bacterium]